MNLAYKCILLRLQFPASIGQGGQLCNSGLVEGHGVRLAIGSNNLGANALPRRACGKVLLVRF